MVPAAPLAYMKVVAVKKLVAGFLLRIHSIQQQFERCKAVHGSEQLATVYTGRCGIGKGCGSSEQNH